VGAGARSAPTQTVTPSARCERSSRAARSDRRPGLGARGRR
jgi:hypothetical protein